MVETPADITSANFSVTAPLETVSQASVAAESQPPVRARRAPRSPQWRALAVAIAGSRGGGAAPVLDGIDRDVDETGGL